MPLKIWEVGLAIVAIFGLNETKKRVIERVLLTQFPPNCGADHGLREAEIPTVALRSSFSYAPKPVELALRLLTYSEIKESWPEK